MSAQSGKNFFEAMSDKAFLGRLAESAVGAQIELFYWREGDKEVDFVLQLGEKLVAIEVKSTQESMQRSGVDSFVQQFNPDRILLVGNLRNPSKVIFVNKSKLII